MIMVSALIEFLIGLMPSKAQLAANAMFLLAVMLVLLMCLLIFVV